MIRISDVFGRALAAYYRGVKDEHIIERDDGYLDKVNTGIYFREYDDWVEQERRAIQEAEGRILDVGCGVGRVALWLQEQGHDVVGIDVSTLALEIAKKRGVDDCRLMDVRELDFPEGYFDAIVLFGNNFGLAGGIKQTRQMLESLYKVTCKDGIILAATRDPLKTDNPYHLAYHEINRSRGDPGTGENSYRFRRRVW
ncbi:MAG: class I SAM-dependent methyltransferase [Candidatus Bathyarchaeia archaeon]